MDLQLKDHHVLITGGSKGIGLACAQAFLSEGARVTLVSRDAGNLDKAQTQLRAQFAGATVHTVAADLRHAAQAEQAVAQAQALGGEIDVLINSAGAAKRTPPKELTAQSWHDAMDAKYFSTLHVLDPVSRAMAARGRGAVVNIIGAGGMVANPIHMPGGAANAALMLVTAGMAAAYGPQGVRVNAINPGQTLTDRLKEGMAAEARMKGISVEQAQQQATARIPLGRMAEPEEIANAAVFLASNKASYISGVVLTMDGVVNPIVV
jgi:NAD(P)-dependent dehydrogenase (short-subunit alcohol dehydrogenase family)